MVEDAEEAEVEDDEEEEVEDAEEAAEMMDVTLKTELPLPGQQRHPSPQNRDGFR